MSFKHGVFEGERNGRYFLDFTEEKLEQLLKKHTSLQQLRNFLTEDVRPDREERWLNLFLKRSILNCISELCPPGDSDLSEWRCESLL